MILKATRRSKIVLCSDLILKIIENEYGFESHRGHGRLSVVSCCVLSGRGLCDELITRTEETYRLWCVVVCDLETSKIRRP